MIGRTPNLHAFTVLWYLQPTQLKHHDREFITERFIEDIMDGRSSISLVVLETHMPNLTSHVVGTDVVVEFKIVAEEHAARELIDFGYKVTPDNPGEMQTKWGSNGMTWQELLSLVNHKMREASADKADTADWATPIRLTDDSDPDAPWYTMTGIKHDDDGIFISLEIDE